MKKFLLLAVALFAGVVAFAAPETRSATADEEMVTIRAWMPEPMQQFAKIVVLPKYQGVYGPAYDVTVKVKKGTPVRIELDWERNVPQGTYVEFWNGTTGYKSGDDFCSFIAEEDMDVYPSMVWE